MKPTTDTNRATHHESVCHASCANPRCCPLSRVRAGMEVRIRELSATDDVNKRLREIGFVERQIIKLVTSQTNLICQVCNTRLALSAELAKLIIVEPLVA